MNSLLLFSGGIDSAALAYWKRPDLLLHIDYGQIPASGELKAAQIIATRLNLPLKELRADCSAVGSGDLAGRPSHSRAPTSSWWPFRNQLLATLGSAVALDLGLDTVLIGTVASDDLYSDGGPEFFRVLRSLIELQEGKIGLEAPALYLTTGQLIQMSGIPCSMLGWAFSCHMSNWACGQCRGCLNRYRTIRDACS